MRRALNVCGAMGRFYVLLPEDGAVDQDVLLNAVKKADFEMVITA